MSMAQSNKGWAIFYVNTAVSCVGFTIILTQPTN